MPTSYTQSFWDPYAPNYDPATGQYTTPAPTAPMPSSPTAPPPSTSPWGGWNAGNIGQYGYGTDLVPLANQVGVSRDELATQRDAFLRPYEQQYGQRATTAGARADAGGAELWADPQFRAFVTQGIAPQFQSTQPPQSTGTATLPSTAQTTENKGRSDSFWTRLLDRANQPLDKVGESPIINRQVDAYRSEQERARRNAISDAAERYGPLANIRGEERMAAENVGRNVSGFRANLTGQELQTLRNEITGALTMQGQFLSADRQAALQEKLTEIDAQLRQQGLSQDWQRALMGQDLSLRQLGLQDYDRQMYWDMIQRGLIG